MRNARPLLLALILPLFVVSAVEAQRGKPLPTDPKILKNRYRKKMNEPWMQVTPWLRSMKKAKKLSLKKKVPIVAYFTRSFSW